MIVKLRGIEGTKTDLDKINKKIQDYMIKTIPNYSADQWSQVIKHRTQNNKYILIMPIDNRNPEKILNTNEKSLIKSDITAREYIIQYDELPESVKNG